MAPSTLERMLPASLALVDDDAEFSEYLAQFLRGQGVAVRWFVDAEALLTSEGAFDHGFYVVDLMLSDIDGLSLVRMLRRRTNVGVLVVSGKVERDVFEQVMRAGADMLLAKPASFEQVQLAIASVYRRAGGQAATLPSWRLDERAALLIAPDGAQIELSPTDLAVLVCLLDADGGMVPREVLGRRLGLNADEAPNLLHATIYRLRRRIERATTALAPLQSKSRMGYTFRAPLVRA